MKKIRVMLAGLVLTMALGGLTACGNGVKDNNNGTTNNGTNTNTENNGNGTGTNGTTTNGTTTTNPDNNVLNTENGTNVSFRINQG